MSVAYDRTIERPRRLILAVNMEHESSRYTVCTEDGYGIGYVSERSLRSLPEWLQWADLFVDELTGRELREAKSHAAAPFVEPKQWAEFRARYAETGNPWSNRYE